LRWRPFKSAVERRAESERPPPLRDVLDEAGANRLYLTLVDWLRGPFTVDAFVAYLAFHSDGFDEELVTAQRKGELELRAHELLGRAIARNAGDRFRLARFLDLYAQYLWIARDACRPRRLYNSQEAALNKALTEAIAAVNRLLEHDAIVYRIEPDSTYHFAVHKIGDQQAREQIVRPALAALRDGGRDDALHEYERALCSYAQARHSDAILQAARALALSGAILDGELPPIGRALWEQMGEARDATAAEYAINLAGVTILFLAQRRRAR
jgi:hypothetical protein